MALLTYYQETDVSIIHTDFRNNPNYVASMIKMEWPRDMRRHWVSYKYPSGYRPRRNQDNIPVGGTMSSPMIPGTIKRKADAHDTSQRKRARTGLEL